MLATALLIAAFIIFSNTPENVSTLDTATTTSSTPPSSAEVTPPVTPPPTSSRSGTQSATPQSLPLVNKDGVYLVYYRNAGFYPQKLTLKLGTSVRFINLSDRAMRIFSAERIDPRFTVLTQPQSLGKGEVYNFTFISRGEWGFYNQSNPQDAGVITIY